MFCKELAPIFGRMMMKDCSRPKSNPFFLLLISLFLLYVSPSQANLQATREAAVSTDTEECNGTLILFPAGQNACAELSVTACNAFYRSNNGYFVQCWVGKGGYCEDMTGCTLPCTFNKSYIQDCAQTVSQQQTGLTSDQLDYLCNGWSNK
jgi:uncharacterized membrane protein